jgi:excisionase family DNA binding protein
MIQVARVLNLGRDAAYALAHRPGFPVVQVGRRLLISRDALRHWLDQEGGKK